MNQRTLLGKIVVYVWLTVVALWLLASAYSLYLVITSLMAPHGSVLSREALIGSFMIQWCVGYPVSEISVWLTPPFAGDYTKPRALGHWSLLFLAGLLQWGLLPALAAWMDHRRRAR